LNLAIRSGQPSTAANRSSQATGFDFYYCDRVEIEDSVSSNQMMEQVLVSLGLGNEKGVA
jgi:hypothetical protein